MSKPSPSPEFWHGKRVLVTGQTGFKGGWLALWLAEMGADVYGLALPPEDKRGIFVTANLENRITNHIGDIRDPEFVRETVARCQPDCVFHLAAQALVRRAHKDPIETYSSNMSGLATILEALAQHDTTRAIVVATSDKVYENNDEGRPFIESDRLGGVEPYGISKAAGEFIVEAFRRSLPADTKLGVATARAGNVIGGGDWSEDRLIPDAITSFAANKPLEVRNPSSTRPWQHVFDPLAGYLLLAEHLIAGSAEWRSSWNFGPDGDGTSMARSVGEIAGQLVNGWNNGGGSPPASWLDASVADAPYEAKLLAVDSSKARKAIDWAPRIPLEQALELTINWYVAQQNGSDMALHAKESLASAYPLS